MNYDYDSEQDTSPECGFAGLATAIIGGGLADLKELRHRERARAFFVSCWFDVLADASGLDPVAVRERLRGRRLL